jgi:dipeptidyl aminopeptidase/acylaminoacyl peptidase
VLLVHGSDDTLVPVAHTYALAAALRATATDLTVRVVPGEDHGSIYAPTVAGPIVLHWWRSRW